MIEKNELPGFDPNWTPPPELSGGVPREVRLTAGGIALSCLAVLAFVTAIAGPTALTRVASRQMAEREELRVSGVETQGVVTRHWRTGDKDDTPMIAYNFEYNGETYSGSSPAPGSIWRDLTVGSPIGVRFSPKRPELNHPSRWERQGMPPWVPPLFGAMPIFMGLMLILLIRRQTRLLSEGRAAPGRVIGYRRVKGGKVLRYEFALLGGGTATGRGGQSRRPPAVGSTICIVYDRDNPKRNAPYPFPLARVDR
jgi:hypothetical protein